MDQVLCDGMETPWVTESTARIIDEEAGSTRVRSLAQSPAKSRLSIQFLFSPTPTCLGPWSDRYTHISF